MEFAKVLKANGVRKNGYLESDKWVITWCVGHLVTMSYPEKYDEKYKYWRLDTLPFIPQEYKYEVIPAVENQFNIIKNLFSREDIDTIYVGTDSGREGEYIYRLVAQMINVQGKEQKRIWIDSQTEEEINALMETRDEAVREAKKLKGAPMVVIKAKTSTTDNEYINGPGATYESLVDVLDEMIVCSVGKYAVVDMTDGDLFLMGNFKTQGQLAASSDFGAK